MDSAAQPGFSPASAELSLLLDEITMLKSELADLRGQALKSSSPAQPSAPPNVLDTLVQAASSLIPVVGPLLGLL